MKSLHLKFLHLKSLSLKSLSLKSLSLKPLSLPGILAFILFLGGPFTTFTVSADVTSVLASASRSDADKEMDQSRKPGEFLTLVGVQPGMAVIDVFAGGGYYTEILSGLVGDDGFVTMYNNRAWDDFVGESVEKRLGGKRLPNVDRLVMPPEDIGELPDKFDVAIFVLGMHDIYYADEENGWPLIDRKRFLKGIYNILDDGGVLGVIDHNGVAGSDPAIVGKELHRVDPAVVISDLEAVGFKLERRSDVLANKDDDLTVSVFDPNLRGRTDRSILVFRK